MRGQRAVEDVSRVQQNLGVVLLHDLEQPTEMLVVFYIEVL